MQELLKSFVSAGVAARRILFAPRADKNAHIRRHAAADLFLDTIVYGAHSTATDALRGVRREFVFYFPSFFSKYCSFCPFTCQNACNTDMCRNISHVGPAGADAVWGGLPQSCGHLVVCLASAKRSIYWVYFILSVCYTAIAHAARAPAEPLAGDGQRERVRRHRRTNRARRASFACTTR